MDGVGEPNIQALRREPPPLRRLTERRVVDLTPH
jgi:hypothetical protein